MHDTHYIRCNFIDILIITIQILLFMFIHKPTNLKFENRKQAISVMGTSRYNKALRNKEFDFNVENKKK